MVGLPLEKEVEFMETHNAIIERGESKVSLKLQLNESELEIVLTEDKPNDVKEVFNNLIQHLKGGEFEFELKDEKKDLYYHICSEYLSQLNVELKSVYKELEDNGLIDSTKPSS